MKGRPYVILNMASTMDGRIGLRGKRPLKLSSEEDFARVHRLRSECDAVLVGVETVLADDPKLTVKERFIPGGRNPLRIVLDSKGRLPEGSAVLDGRSSTLVVTSEDCQKEFPPAEVLRVGSGRVDLRQLLATLAERGFERVLVEGGGTVAWSFLKEDLVDLVHIYFAPLFMGDTEAPSLFAGGAATHSENLKSLKLRDVTILEGGLLVTLVRPEKGNVD